MARKLIKTPTYRTPTESRLCVKYYINNQKKTHLKKLNSPVPSLMSFIALTAYVWPRTRPSGVSVPFSSGVGG